MTEDAFVGGDEAGKEAEGTEKGEVAAAAGLDYQLDSAGPMDPMGWGWPLSRHCF